jgi:cytochrome b561
MFRNSAVEWGWPAKVLHWIGALAILVLLGHGWWMTHMVARPERLANYAWHAALGYDLLALSIVRLLWRSLNPVPTLPAETKPWERLAAHGGHVGLYVLMFVVAGTGWVVATTFRTPMTGDLVGIHIPALVTNVERGVRDLFEETHKILAYGLAALIVLHVAGALRHHLLKKNDVLRRMI